MLKTVANRDKPPKDFKLVVAEQLLQHQQMMVDRMLATPLTLKSMGPYLVPVRDSDQMRCWGSSNDKADAQFMVDNASCAMESAVFISETLQTGQVSIQHQFIRSNKLNAARFAELASATFKDVRFGSNKDTRLTAPSCTEQFVKNKTLPLRAVLCVRAYRKFAGLYNFGLLTASTDNGLMGLQSRLDARGVSYDNGLRLSRAFMDALARGSKP